MPTIRDPLVQRAQKARAEGEGRVIHYDPDMHPGIVRRLAMMGATRERIAAVLGISPNTLRNWADRHEELRLELLSGSDLADAEVVAAMYDAAVGYIDEKTGRRRGCNVTAQIFWLKNRRGWHDGRTAPKEPEKMSPEEMAEVAARLAKKLDEGTKTIDDEFTEFE